MSHLTISRRVGESFKIGDDVEITIQAIHGNQARVSIKAPRSVSILRSELARFVGLDPGGADKTALRCAHCLSIGYGPTLEEAKINMPHLPGCSRS